MTTPLITIDEAKCKKDGVCAAECPLSIIEQKDPGSFPRQTDDAEELCIGCGHCVASARTPRSPTGTATRPNASLFGKS